MHMSKVRTTINLNEDVVKKAKKLGINISAIAERGLIEYIKELENIERENNNSNNHTPQIDGQSSESNLKRRGGDSNSCSPHGEPAFKYWKK